MDKRQMILELLKKSDPDSLSKAAFEIGRSLYYSGGETAQILLNLFKEATAPDEGNTEFRQGVMLALTMAATGLLSIENDPVEPDPFAKWINEHQDEYYKHEGEIVCIHPEKGIIAHGESIQEVADRLHGEVAEEDNVAFVLVEKRGVVHVPIITAG